MVDEGWREEREQRRERRERGTERRGKRGNWRKSLGPDISARAIARTKCPRYKSLSSP